METYDFSQFFLNYIGDAGYQTKPIDWENAGNNLFIEKLPKSYQSFLTQIEASSFNNAALRILTPTTEPTLQDWNRSNGWASSWPKLAGRLMCFGYDWLGRHLAFDLENLDPITKEPVISVFEPAAKEVIVTNVKFHQFINYDLVIGQEELLAIQFYAAWQDSGGVVPKFDQCIGYKIPLFLGGKDDLENLELINLDVYITLTGQIANSLA